MLPNRILTLTFSLAYLPYVWATTCSRAVSRSEKYQVHCHTWGWGRCTNYRTRYSRQYYCCPGWHGAGCSTPICNRRCQNGGTCVGPEKCKCDVYHSGSQCQTEVANCGRQPCQNGGTCVGPERCRCDLFHYGHSCQFKKSCNHKELELLFLLDSSGNIGHSNFETLKTFVKYVIKQFDISRNKTRVGLMTYSHYPFIRFALRDDINTSQVLNAVDNIPYIAGVTETHTALHLLQQEGFLGSRSNVAHVGVLLTTSTSLHRNETETIANNLNRQGIQMFVVGIGDRISKAELSTIATNPDDHHLILVHNFTMITDIQEKLTTLICDVPTHTYTPPTTTQTLLIQTARREPIKTCKGKVADIVILLDSSRSLGAQHFTSVDHFALDIVNDLDIAENATMVGVISFSTYPVRRVKLGSMVDKLSILNSINQIQYYPGARETDKALQMLRLEGFDGERLGVPNIVILLTDGSSTNPFLTGRAADELKQSGVEVFAVGIGNKVSQTELDRISSGGNNHVLTVHNFLELDMSSFKSNVAETVCGAIPTFTTTTMQTTTPSTTASTSEPTTTTSSIKTTTVKTASTAALELLRTQGFTNDRPGAPNIAFLITDGYSTDKNATERQAILAKENNTIQIFATGIGQLLDFQELWTIASSNPITNKSLIYHVEDFDDLHVNSLEKILTDVICGSDLATTTISTTTVSTTVSTTTQISSAPCVDKVSNCDEYEETMCTSYRPWAIAHCERHCGYCQGAPTTPVPCVDTIGNCREFGHDICTSSSFHKWTKEHCARFCEFCGVNILTASKQESSTTETTTASSTTTTPITPNALVNETTEQNNTLDLSICSNKISNCADYGLDICSDYTPWATEHCRMFCGFCQGPSTTPKPCVDTIRNCHEFPPNICTSLSFVKWTKEHCAKYCQFCGIDILTVPKAETPTTETTTASSTTTTTTTTTTTSTALVNETTEQNNTLGLSICSNKISNCADYVLDMCSDYTPWATEHCKMFCGFCQGPSTTPKPCVDTIGNCHEFPPDICTSLTFVKWTKDHCAKFCKFCDVSSS